MPGKRKCVSTRKSSVLSVKKPWRLENQPCGPATKPTEPWQSLFTGSFGATVTDDKNSHCVVALALCAPLLSTIVTFPS